MTKALVKPFEFAATKAMQDRKRKKEKVEARKRGEVVSSDESASGTDTDGGSKTDGSASDSTGQPSRRSKSKDKKKRKKQSAADSDDGTAAGTVSDGNASDAASESTVATEPAGPAPIQYKVVFGATVRSSPPLNPAAYSVSSSSSASAAAAASASKYRSPAAPSNPPSKPFKASKIPWTSQVSMLDSIVKEREAARAERVKERAQKLMEEAAMPSRMEAAKHKQQKAKEKGGAAASGGSGVDDTPEALAAAAAAERRRLKKMPPVPTYKPSVNLSVPDFDRLHAEFASDLEKVKRNYETTKLEPFDITASKSKVIAYERPPQFKAKPYIASGPPAEGTPPSTKKQDQLAEKTRMQVAAREEKERLAEKERQAALKQNPDMFRKLVPKIASTHAHGSATTHETIKRLVAAKNKELKQADAEWAERVDAMKARVRERPLLVESYNNAAGRVEARKRALLAIKESLDKAGIEDQSRFFDQDELRDLDLNF